MTRTIDWLRERCDIDGKCWLWSRSTQSKGYPQANIDGKLVLVQRYAYTEIHGKTLPPKFVVTTRCRNRVCCSESCLVGKPRGQILARAYAEGARSIHRELIGHRNTAMKNGLVRKLDMVKAREIRALRPSMTLVQLAERYDVNPDTISRVCSQRMWRETINGASVFSWRPN